MEVNHKNNDLKEFLKFIKYINIINYHKIYKYNQLNWNNITTSFSGYNFHGILNKLLFIFLKNYIIYNVNNYMDLFILENLFVRSSG